MDLKYQINKIKGMETNLRILFFTRRLDREDPRIGFVHRWVEEFSTQVSKIYVVCLETGVVNLPKNVEVFPLGPSKVIRPFKFFYIMSLLVPRVDVVFCHMNPIYAILSSPLSHLLRKKLALWYTHGAVSLRLRLAVLLSDVLFTASDESLRVNTPKKRVVGHGIDTNLFKPKSRTKRKRKLLLSVGRISRIKGYEDLLLGLRGLLNKGISAELWIVGSAELMDEIAYLSELKKLAKRLRISDRVRFIGPVSQSRLPQIYNSADLFVSNSHTGSLDKAILEAMACNRPVLVSNPAFRGILPEAFLFSSLEDFEKKAQGILFHSFPLPNLRKIAERHNISNLSRKILQELEK